MNISGIVIKVKEKKFHDVLDTLKYSNLWEVHFHQDEKIVVTIEGNSTDEEIKRLKRIEMIDGVLSAEMVYAYSEHELESERVKIDMSEDVPSWLNNNDIKAHQIKYKGDVKM